MNQRTTLILNDQMLRDLKSFAARRKQTLSAVVDQFLRYAWQHFAEQGEERRPPRPLPSAKDMGTPAIDFADREALYDFFDTDEPA